MDITRRLILSVGLALPAVALARAPSRADQSLPEAPACPANFAGIGEADIQKFRGKVVYADFWASWCAPCLLSFPFMNNLQQQFGEQGLQVLAFNMDEKPEDAEKFLSAHPAHFAVAMGQNGPCAKQFGVKDMPSSFLIDRNGKVRAEHRGFREGDVGDLRAHVQKLLSEKANG